MSDANIPGDIPGAGTGAGTGPGGVPPGAAQVGGQQQPSEEEIRQYLAQLRQTDVTEIIAQTFSMLAQSAEVKLGRRDGRLLIDTVAAVTEAVEPHLDDRLTDQMREALSQLQEGQVDAEEQLQQLRDEGRLPDDEENDLPREGQAPAEPTDAGAEGEQPPTPPRQGRPSTQQGGGGSSDRLWVPGR